MILKGARVSFNGVPFDADSVGLTLRLGDLDESEFQEPDLTFTLHEPVTITRTFDADEWAVIGEHCVVSNEPGKF